MLCAPSLFIRENIFTVSYGKEAENRVLNDPRHFDDVTSDGRLFQVLAALHQWGTLGPHRSPIVSGTASAEVDDERRRCRPGSLATGCRASAR